MTRVVVFTQNNARVLYVQDHLPYVGQPNVLIDPDMVPVLGIPPHFWKIDGLKLAPMNEAERAERLESHETYGVVNDHALPFYIVPESEPLPPAPSIVPALLVGGAAAAAGALALLVRYLNV